MNKDLKRTAFINATIQTIAHEGIDKATTKRISEAAGGLNEVYIYRLFENKEDLYKIAFLTVSKKFNSEFLKLIPLFNKEDIKIDDQWWLFITGLWNYILEHENECMCYLQYYYSPYYKELSMKEHQALCHEVIQALKPTFKEGTNVDLLYDYILGTIITFVIKVIYNDDKYDIEVATQVYEIIYAAVKPYLLPSPNN